MKKISLALLTLLTISTLTACSLTSSSSSSSSSTIKNAASETSMSSTTTDASNAMGTGGAPAGQPSDSQTSMDMSSSNTGMAPGEEEATYVHGHGLHADSTVTIKSGTVTIEDSYEWWETSIMASDDGFNASSDDDNTAALLSISGGTVTVNTYGDGLDSNGDIEMSGGTVIVDGPTSGNDGALDSGDNDNTITVTGGTLIAIGSRQMAENPSDTSSQIYSSFDLSDDISKGETLTFSDGDTEIASFEALKARSGNTVVQISTADISSGSSYTFTDSTGSTTFTGGDNVETMSMGGGGF